MPNEVQRNSDEQEWIVEDIKKHRWNERIKCWEYFTTWKQSNQKTWELKSSFIDDNGDKNEIWKNIIDYIYKFYLNLLSHHEKEMPQELFKLQQKG